MSIYEYKNGLMINKKTGISVSMSNKSTTEPEEKELVDMILGKEPKNSKQRALKKQIEAIKDAGGSVDVPSI